MFKLFKLLCVFGLGVAVGKNYDKIKEKFDEIGFDDGYRDGNVGFTEVNMDEYDDEEHENMKFSDDKEMDEYEEETL